MSGQSLRLSPSIFFLYPNINLKKRKKKWAKTPVMWLGVGFIKIVHIPDLLQVVREPLVLVDPTLEVAYLYHIFKDLLFSDF